MADEDKALTSPDSTQKLKESRSSLAGWLTRAINQVQSVKLMGQPGLVESLKERIAGCLKSLQAAHNRYMLALHDEAEISDAETWMDAYFQRAADALKQCDVSDVPAGSPNRSDLPTGSQNNSVDSLNPDAASFVPPLPPTGIEPVQLRQPNSRSGNGRCCTAICRRNRASYSKVGDRSRSTQSRVADFRWLTNRVAEIHRAILRTSPFSSWNHRCASHRPVTVTCQR